MSLEELTRLFSLEHCSKSGAKFDYKKGIWFNHDLFHNGMWTVTSFLDNLQYERNYSEETIKAYREDICQFENFVSEEFGSVELSSVTPDIVREWIMSLMDKGYTSTSINRKLSALRSLYKYLLRFNLVSVDPLRKVTGPKNKKKLPVFLKETDMVKIFGRKTPLELGFMQVEKE